MRQIKTICTVMGCAVLSSAIMLASGCGSGSRTDADRLMLAYRSNDLVTASEIAGQRAGSLDQEHLSNDADHLVWRLEQGTVLRTKGDLEASERAYDFADWAIEYFDEQPEVSLLGETGATLTNLSTLPYRGYAYDRIMLSTYRALNMLKLGDHDTARVELNRAFVRQQEAIERNRQRIEAAEEEALAAQKEGIIDEGSRPSEVDQLSDFDILYAEVYQAQGDYVNPFTEFLQGLFYLFAGQTADDFESGRHAIMRVAAMVGDDNPYIADDLAMAERISAGSPPPTLTYVIFETGVAPSRKETRIDIPVPVRGVGHVAAAFPELAFHEDYEPHLMIDHDGRSMHTAHLADMDTIIGLEFKNELPAVTARTIQIAATQAAAQYGISQGARGSAGANLITTVFGSTYRSSQAKADLRTWNTLPKQFQYARMETPENRTITIRTPSGHSKAIQIEPGHANVVYVKSTQRDAPIQTWQLRLR